MSGPKVVRIVTREEVIAICKGHLARLDRALDQWLADGLHQGLIGETEITAARRRRDQIAGRLAKDEFVQLQKEAPGEIEYLQADYQARLDKAARAAAEARKRARREKQAAAALLETLRQSRKDVPPEVEAGLSEAAAGRGAASVALAAGFALLNAAAPATATHLKELAQSLKGEEANRSILAWIDQQPRSKDEEIFARIELRIEELAALSGPEVASAFVVRFEALQASGNDDRRPLLLDSIALDLGRTLADARALNDLSGKVQAALAELRSLNPDRAAEFDATSLPGSRAELESLLQSAEAAIVLAREEQAAAARRHVVLQSLAAIGYEVGEELSTAWVKDGRLVLRKPSQPGYGMEITGGANAERLQMRVVAFGEAPPDAARDRDAETLWCGDVAALQARLKGAGGGLSIERALEIGATPVKRVNVGDAADRPSSVEAPLRPRAFD